MAKLRSESYSYLGLISSSKTHPDSVCNPNGKYGSPVSEVSVRNKIGPYGKPWGGTDLHDPLFNPPYSAYNELATKPPRIELDGVVIAWLSTSETYGASSIHPDVLFFHLGCAY